MKVFALTAVSLLVASAVLIPTSASAQHSRKVVGHCNVCRQPVFAYPRVIGYDSCRRPVVRWISQPHSRCSSYRSRSPYSSYNSYGRGSSCNQSNSRYYNSPYRSRDNVSIRFNFGR